MTESPDLPASHEAFLGQAVTRIAEDPRFVGVAAAGSHVTGGVDEYSDIDLVLAVEPAVFPQLLAERMEVAAALGPLLAGFTGEHVGEPRLLICLYGPPLLHVDLKFVSLDDLDEGVEKPRVLWERDGRLGARLESMTAAYPEPDRQWIEDRFWVWVHYGAAKIGRGELFETLDMLAFLRGRVLGPLALQRAGARPTGVRRIEAAAPRFANRLRETVAAPEARSCARALRACVSLYRELRSASAEPPIQTRDRAEHAALAYLDEVAPSRDD